jgi:hypothetical protein
MRDIYRLVYIKATRHCVRGKKVGLLDTDTGEITLSLEGCDETAEPGTEIEFVIYLNITDEKGRIHQRINQISMSEIEAGKSGLTLKVLEQRLKHYKKWTAKEDARYWLEAELMELCPHFPSVDEEAQLLVASIPPDLRKDYPVDFYEAALAYAKTYYEFA